MKKACAIVFLLCLYFLCISDPIVFSQKPIQSNLQSQSLFNSEKPIARMIQQIKNDGEQFPVVDLFSEQTSTFSETAAETTTFKSTEKAVVKKALKDGAILRPNPEAVSAILENDLKTVTLPLRAAKTGAIELELVKADIHTEDFTVTASGSDWKPVEYEQGAHYRGTVKGNPRSIAAISVFRNEIVGFYSTEQEGNFVLGRLGGKNVKNYHILYSDKDLKAKPSFSCGTKDDDQIIPPSYLQNPQASSLMPQGFGFTSTKAVRIYVETDFNLYQDPTIGGSLANVTNYITAVFNQSATLYSNEGIQILLSQVNVWNTPSPYSGDDAHTLLGQFKSFRTSFNGDFGHLVKLMNNSDHQGGEAAGFVGFCNINVHERQCFSGIDPTFSSVPTYSWTVEVFTHEMGHLMGSRHTHACVWNGNGTAIDGCAGKTEGGCPLPGIPAGGGTIMSYCHLTNAGINLSLGFGPQPGNVIRNQYANAGCLTLVEPVLRYWSSNTGEHFYTANFNELGNGGGGWVSEGTHFHAYSRNEILAGILLHVPLYRYWSSQSGYHFYTTNPNEVAGLPEWQYEGIQCYVDSVQAQNDVKLYRYWNTKKGYHFYTTNPNEVAGLPEWQYEGIQCYVLP